MFSVIALSPIVAALAEAADEHGAAASALWEDTSIWVGIGFKVVAYGIIYIGVHKQIGAALDRRAQKISDELDVARRLREEAQEHLARFQRRQREAEEEALTIVEQAKKDAKRMSAEMRDKLAEQLARRAKAAEEKIERAEARALADVRNETVNVAVSAAEAIVRNRMDQGALQALNERAVDELRGRLN
ncbi:MAG: F0F1 ATP synthase subunit B [Parvularculaceae bacterium]